MDAIIGAVSNLLKKPKAKSKKTLLELIKNIPKGKLIDINAIFTLIAEGGDLNAIDSNDNTALMIAAAQGDTATVTIFLSIEDIGINQLKLYKDNALIFAAYFGHLDIVEILLADSRILINQSGKQGGTALIAAAEKGHTDIVNRLLAVPGILVNKANIYGNTPLRLAISGGHTETVVALLKAPGILIDNLGRNNENTLMFVVGSGKAAIVSAFLALPGISESINEERMYCETPLIKASSRNYIEVVKVLLVVPGMDINQENGFNENAFSLSTIGGRTEMAALLESHGAVVPRRSMLNVTKSAADTRLYEDENVFEQTFTNFGRQTSRESSTSSSDEPRNPFLKLIEDTPEGTPIDVSVIDAFFENEYDNEVLKAQNEEGKTAFMLMAERGDTAAAMAMLKNASISEDKGDRRGYSALMLAAEKGHTGTVIALYSDCPVFVNHQSNFKFTALMVAAQKGDTGMVIALLSAPRIAVNIKNGHDDTALMLAAQFGRLTTVTTLLAVSDIEVNCADEGGNTALMLASRNGHIGVVRALLAFNKIKINSTNKNGESAIALAFEHRHPNIISLLEEKGAIIPEDLRQINCAAHLAAPSPGVTFSYTADTEEKKLQSCSLAVECNAGLGKKKKTKKN